MKNLDSIQPVEDISLAHDLLWTLMRTRRQDGISLERVGKIIRQAFDKAEVLALVRTLLEDHV